MPPKITNDVLLARLDSIVDKQAEHTESLKYISYVLNGRNGGPGMITRLDRLEQAAEQRKWHVRALWAAFLAGFTSMVFK